MTWTATPQSAWLTQILPRAGEKLNWLEASSDISSDIPLSNRELFALILVAYLYGPDGKPWSVGYDDTQSEPNDGFITDGISVVRFEHKIVSHRDAREALNAILGTYSKYAKRGKAYGEGRTLLIQPNKSSDHGGAVRISDLREEIGKTCPFDQVFTLGAVRHTGTEIVMQMLQHHPWPISLDVEHAKGFGQVNFDTQTGKATVRVRNFDRALGDV